MQELKELFKPEGMIKFEELRPELFIKNLNSLAKHEPRVKTGLLSDNFGFIDIFEKNSSLIICCKLLNESILEG